MATGKWNFLGGSLYLLAINTVFIALSALITTRFFGQPLIQQTDPHKKQLANRYVSIIVILTLVPSVVLGVAFIGQDHFNRQVKGFISNIKVENNYLLKYEVSPSRKQINLTFGGIGLSKTQKDELEQQLKAQGIVAELNFQQGFSFSQIGDINVQTELLRKELSHLREDITKIKQQSAPNANNTLAQTLLLELQSLYPQIQSVSLANIEQSSSNNPASRLLIIQVNNSKNNTLSQSNLTTWAQQRLQDANILVLTI